MWETAETLRREVWALAAKQHGLVTRAQLTALGLSRRAIEHRLVKGRLHRARRGVYAVGRPELTRHGAWMAAVLSCGSRAFLSHASAAALWGIRPDRGGVIHVSVLDRCHGRPGFVIHERTVLSERSVARCEGIPVTSPIITLVDLASDLPLAALERAVNEADRLNLIDPEALRYAAARTRRPGVAALRRALDRRTFALTDSELERRFLPLSRRAGLAAPETRRLVNGVRVDFVWPTLGLVVETDGLRYHRTPAQQAQDRVRDQTHTAAGLTCLRFTHAQVEFEPARVEAILRAVARRLAT